MARIKTNWTVAAGVTLALAAAGAARADDVIIHAGRLIDGVGKAPRETMSIVIHDDRIASVVPGVVSPPGARVIDLSRSTVLPGLIDCHDHITQSFHPGGVHPWSETRKLGTAG